MNRLVVEGDATSIEDWEKDSPLKRVKFKISHVYLGPADLLGKLFWEPARQSGDFTGDLFMPIPLIGERGIFVLFRQDDDNQLFSEHAGDAPFGLRLGVDSHYNDAKALAEALSRLSLLLPADRLAEIRKLVHDPIAMISVWAIDELHRFEGPASDDYLIKTIADTTVSVEARVRIDELLSTDDFNQKWQRSEKRIKLILGWCDEKMDTNSTRIVVSRLNSAETHSSIDPDIYLQSLKRLLANPVFISSTTKPNGVVRIESGVDSELINLGSLVHDQSKAFDLLLYVLKTQHEPIVLEAAIKGMTYFTSFSDDQMRRLRDVMPSLPAAIEAKRNN